jgi:hypothetical protein
MRVPCVLAVLALVTGASTVSDANERPPSSRTMSHSDHRPEQCPVQAWCGCWLATYLGIKNQKQWRELWVARNWTTFGRPAEGPAPGVIAVYGRGTGGHVGIVTSVRRAGFVVLKSGNDNGAVRERERTTHGVIAWRIPGES